MIKKLSYILLLTLLITILLSSIPAQAAADCNVSSYISGTTSLAKRTPSTGSSGSSSGKGNAGNTSTAGSAGTSSSSSAVTSMKVTPGASCSNYNHVGNEWGYSFTVNGTQVSSGSTVKVKAGDKITVEATVVEYDDSKDDVGSNSKTVTVTQSDIDKGFKVSFSVNVKENGGRYSGNIATWDISVSFK